MRVLGGSSEMLRDEGLFERSFFHEEPAIPARILQSTAYFTTSREFGRARNSSAKGWRTCTTIKPSDLRSTLYGPRPDAPASRIFRRFSADLERANETSFYSSRFSLFIAINFFFLNSIHQLVVEISTLTFDADGTPCIVSPEARLERTMEKSVSLHVRNVYGWMLDVSLLSSFCSSSRPPLTRFRGLDCVPPKSLLSSSYFIRRLSFCRIKSGPQLKNMASHVSCFLWENNFYVQHVVNRLILRSNAYVFLSGFSIFQEISTIFVMETNTMRVSIARKLVLLVSYKIWIYS